MRLARYWTRAQSESTSPRGKRIVASARGWSNESIDDARTRALEIAGRVAQRIASGDRRGQRYGYGDRPLPEPVLREFAGGDSNAAAVVTRNQYGAMVLNADHLMFVDVDNAESDIAQSAKGLFGSLFGKRPASAATQSDPIVDKMASVIASHQLSGRMYQTKGGYRVLITSSPFTAGSPDADALLNQFGADPLYIRLCRLQECFRARLTPKPWRCNLTDPPVSFPFEDARAQERFARWQENYDAKTVSFATCRFLDEFGSGRLSVFDDLIQYHDAQTKAASSLPLA